MRTFVRIAALLYPFAGLFLLALLFNAGFSFLSTVSIALIHPILQVLFGTASSAAAASTASTGALSSIKEQFYAVVQNLIFSSTPEQTLLNLCLLIIGLFFLKNLLKYVGRIVNAQLTERSVKHIRDILFKKLTHLSLDFFNRQKSGNLISLVTNDVAVVNQTITPIFTILVREPLQVLLLLLLLLSLSVKLTLIAFSSSILSLVIVGTARKYLRRYASRIQNAMAEYSAVLEETISGIKIIKLLSAENSAIRRFTHHTAQYVRAMIKHQKVLGLIPSISEFFAIVALTVVLFIGGQEVFANRMSGEDLMTFLFALFAIMAPITNLIGIPSVVQHGLVAAERIFAVLDRSPSVRSGTKKVPGFHRSIELRNVWFSYEENRPVLKNISLEIPRGSTVALVGESGSGKSTLVDLILRLYDPQKGVILLDGEDIRTFDLASYHSLFGVVTQDPILFNDTVFENIRFAKPDATEEEVRRAARIAYADVFIEQLPNGYQTYIGDRGVRLSGGQRQRIAIARAVLANPPILVFDEATSALDSQSEKIVQDAIQRVMQGKTAIIIAHRLSTIADADRIVVLKNGSIIEQGTHHELIQRGGEYARLVELQKFAAPSEMVVES